MELLTVILDQARDEVIVELRTEIDLNLTEHGVTVYRKKKGKWRFDYAEYLSRYLEQFEDDAYREAFDREFLAEQEAYLKESEAFWKKGGKQKLAAMLTNSLAELSQALSKKGTRNRTVVEESALDEALSQSLIDEALKEQRKSVEALRKQVQKQRQKR